VQQTPNLFPDLPALTEALETALNGRGPVTVEGREPNLQGSFPHEVVTCRFGDGGEGRLFCKYGIGHTASGFGHRGGVPYEAEVYRRVLPGLPLTAAALRGSYTHPATGEVWLFLEFLGRGIRLDSAPRAEMITASAWIGRFHALQEERAARQPWAFLNRYDADYYRGWPRRTAEHAAAGHLARFPWLPAACERFEGVLEELVAPPLTVIHGEYYPQNILAQDGAVYPVDWESAAVARGEIDLASQTERWPEETVAACTAAYRQARWPGGAPPGFERRLDAARVYLHFRWLGYRKDWMADEGRDWRFEDLHCLYQRLGLL
jgi:hypothetical protein